MRIIVFLFIILVFLGCHKESTSPTEQNNPKLGESFDLKIGESVVIKDEQLGFQFVSVPSDSRCPENAICIWSGFAIVVIRISETYDSLYTISNPSETTYGLYTIRLLKLSPYPKIGVPGDTTQYIAQFVVTK